MIDAELVVEIWNAVREYIPSKDREFAAQHVISVLDAHLELDEIEEIVVEDKHLAQAFTEFYEENSEDEDEEEMY